ncbi:DUF859 domain-containing protein [Streptococcus sciuri]|uniref:DUF859 domain-containing protein n=1 Tax=Streptococcus sciuri TaxID=2973939 RepID=A0ABT2F7A9_9STRE|nr:DUF859 domain-containing protein [Streptococcus sciuri]MCS4488371.1 DUF859 domain-containing protein [Streptococcus sciuri]
MAEFWSNNDRGYRIRLWLEQVSQNVQTNSSQVRVRLALLNTTSTFYGYSLSAFVDVNNQRLSWSGSPSMTNMNSTLMLIDQTITVGHNADGTKAFQFAAKFNGAGGFSPGTLMLGVGTFTLTTIARMSAISVGNCVIGSPVTITLKRQNESFTHTIRYWWGDKKGTIATNVATSCSWTIPMNFADDIPDTTSGRGSLYVDTYSGSTLIGTQQTSLIASLPDSVKPSFSGLTLIDTNEKVKALMSENTFVQVLSNVQVSFNGQKGAYGSTITGYRAEIVGQRQVIDSDGGLFGLMNFNGKATVRACVFDSRGRQSEVKEVAINVLEYFAPVLSFSVARSGKLSSTLTVTRNAKIAPLTVSNSQKNVMTLSFRVAKLGTTTFNTDSGQASGSFTTLASLTNSQANLAGTYGADQSFQVTGTLSDSFTSTEFSVTVPTERVVFSYDKLGRLGVGKIAERGAEGSIEATGEVYARDGTALGFYAIAPIANLDEATTAGIYSVDSQTLNQPNGRKTQGFLQVVVTGGATYTDTKNNLWQTYTRATGEVFFRTVDSDGNYQDWIEITPSQLVRANHPNLINTGWQSAGYKGSYYKRVGDVISVRYDFVGTGKNLTIGTIEGWSAPQSYMFVIAAWSYGGGDNSHLQIDEGVNRLTVLNSGKGITYRGQLTIMI